ncbi:endonuclease domain-containing protein [Streptomyces sp. NPDC006208]|uniref:endonuclease domain-containing protein n=1 Tax=Streptomyces sp. NPDC006208 TaxID=3156734 RepID=UPI0033A4310F
MGRIARDADGHCRENSLAGDKSGSERPSGVLPGVLRGVLPAAPGGARLDSRAKRNCITCLQCKCSPTPAELDGTTAERRGVCGICFSAPAEHVDHCPETGRVRGVLCFSCNAALGHFKDRPDVTRRTAAYVEGNAWKPTLVAPGVYQLPS